MVTLARLSFWVPPRQARGFAAVYEQTIAAFLASRGLVASPDPGRRTVPGVFSRLFEMESPKAVALTRHVLRTDLEWQGLLRDLDPAFVAAGPHVRRVAEPSILTVDGVRLAGEPLPHPGPFVRPATLPAGLVRLGRLLRLTVRLAGFVFTIISLRPPHLKQSP